MNTAVDFNLLKAFRANNQTLQKHPICFHMRLKLEATRQAG